MDSVTAKPIQIHEKAYFVYLKPQILFADFKIYCYYTKSNIYIYIDYIYILHTLSKHTMI